MAHAATQPAKANGSPIIRMLFRNLINLAIALALVTSPIWGFMLLMEFSFRYGPGRGDYPAVAPDADFATRRKWGQKEMFEYFELTEKWVRNSSLIAKDVGNVTGVAPIGSPNRFYAGGFTDGSYCTMNLQVIGENGEGVLTLPVVNVNNGYQLYGIADNSTWKFGDKNNLIVLSGKSWLQEAGLDVLVDRVRTASEENMHEDVLATCGMLKPAVDAAIKNESIEPVEFPTVAKDMFDNLPYVYRTEMLHRYADSLFQLGQDDEASKAFQSEANFHIEHAESFRYSNSYSGDRDPTELPRSIEAARVAIIHASSLQPDDKNIKDLARQRALMAHNKKCESFKMYYSGEENAEREALKRSLGDLYGSVVSRANRSAWLREQMGKMDFRIKLNHCNNVRINRKGFYEAVVVLEVSGSWGKSGLLEVSVRESDDGNEPMDLNATTPRDPSYPFTHRRVRWTEADGERIKLSSKTLAPYEKK